MAVKVFKFGGASISSVNNMKKIIDILKHENYEQLAIVSSAIGKTTNALEQVVAQYFINQQEAIHLLKEIEDVHINFCKTLLKEANHTVDLIHNHFVEGYWILEEPPLDSYSYCYDQIVSIGELASTTILASLLNENNIKTHWVDARSCIKTNDNYQEAQVIWELTEIAIAKVIKPKLENTIVVTQGFIGCTDENHTTTLGREGSDFTGAILANVLNAESYTIWKDVPGVLNADPRKVKNTIQLYHLTYREAVEMTYYGAKVIHPKTIKPVQNKKIPLYVRSFLQLKQQGTKICDHAEMKFEKGVIIHLKNQMLLNIVTKDFSFFEEEQITEIMGVVKNTGITINLFQRGAIETLFVIDEDKKAFELLKKTLKDYSITVIEDLTLSTLRHYFEHEVEELKKDKEIFIEQKTPTTYQIVYK